jgi:DNA processing protein
MLAKSLVLDKERVDWIRLCRSQNVGAKTFSLLIKMYGSATEALNNIPRLAAKGGMHRAIKVPSVAEIEDEIAKVDGYGAQLLLSGDANFPSLLKTISDCPAVITVKGKIELFKKKCIGIVGARNASLNGCNFAKNLAKDLAKNEIVTVSGLARGIDTYSHIGAGANSTIAVIAGGIDHIYPKENTSLYEKIANEGLIAAELPIGTAPIAAHFPQRNRIISGISLATVVVEASEKSGSLLTAQFAKRQGRSLLAVPGSPLDPRSKGTNKLIKEGAILLNGVDDVLEILNVNNANSLFSDNIADFEEPLTRMPDEKELNTYRQKFFQMLSHSPTSLEDIADNLELPLHILNVLVLELELAGKVERLYGNKIVKIFE